MHPSTHIIKELAQQRIEQLRSEAAPRPERPRSRPRRALRRWRALRGFESRPPAPEQVG